MWECRVMKLTCVGNFYQLGIAGAKKYLNVANAADEKKIDRNYFVCSGSPCFLLLYSIGNGKKSFYDFNRVMKARNINSK